MGKSKHTDSRIVTDLLGEKVTFIQEIGFKDQPAEVGQGDRGTIRGIGMNDKGETRYVIHHKKSGALMPDVRHDQFRLGKVKQAKLKAEAKPTEEDDTK